MARYVAAAKTRCWHDDVSGWWKRGSVALATTSLSSSSLTLSLSLLSLQYERNTRLAAQLHEPAAVTTSRYMSMLAGNPKVGKYTKAAKLGEKKAIRTLQRTQRQVTAANYAYSHSYMRLLCARSAYQYFSKRPLRRFIVIFQIRSNPIYLGFATWITFEARIPLSWQSQRLKRLCTSHEPVKWIPACRIDCQTFRGNNLPSDPLAHCQRLSPQTSPAHSAWLSRQFDWT